MPIGPPEPTPALLQTTCTLPKRAMVSSAPARTESRLATSTTTPSARTWLERSSSTASCRVSASMSASITVIPARPNALAIASPIPDAPPVMKAVFPLRSCTRALPWMFAPTLEAQSKFLHFIDHLSSPSGGGGPPKVVEGARPGGGPTG